MKRIISIILLTTMLISMAACEWVELETSDVDEASGAESVEIESSSVESTDDEQSDAEQSEPYVYIPRDYLSEWADGECEAYVHSPFNCGTFGFGMDEKLVISYEEKRKLEKELLDRRNTAFFETLDVHETKEWDGITMSLSGATAFQENRRVTYEAPGDEVKVTYNAFSGKPISISYSDDYVEAESKRRKEQEVKIVSSSEEAIKYMKAYVRDDFDVGDDIDLYDHSFHTSYYNNRYNIEFYLTIKGIRVLYGSAQVDEYFGVTQFFCGYTKESVNFYTSCVEYAISEKGWAAVVAALERKAAENHDIVEIKDISPSNMAGRGCASDEKESFLTAKPNDNYGGMEYFYHLDKTAVIVSCKYTVVMKDGTEKRGLNTVAVLVPIDWAEEFGEK